MFDDGIRGVLVTFGQAFTVTMLVTLCFALIFVVLALCLYPFSLATCNALIERTPTHNIQWEFWNGCLIETESGFWADTDDYYIIESGDIVEIGDTNLPLIIKDE